MYEFDTVCVCVGVHTACESSLMTLTVVSVMVGGTTVSTRSPFFPPSISTFTDAVGLENFESMHLMKINRKES